MKSGVQKKSGVDYHQTKYSFTIEPFDYEAGVVGYELRLPGTFSAEIPVYRGKPRGRKPKQESVAHHAWRVDGLTT